MSSEEIYELFSRARTTIQRRPSRSLETTACGASRMRHQKLQPLRSFRLARRQGFAEYALLVAQSGHSQKRPLELSVNSGSEQLIVCAESACTSYWNESEPEAFSTAKSQGLPTITRH